MKIYLIFYIYDCIITLLCNTYVVCQQVIYEALTGHRVSWKKALQLLNERFSEGNNVGKEDDRPCILLIDELDLLVTRNQSVVPYSFAFFFFKSFNELSWAIFSFSFVSYVRNTETYITSNFFFYYYYYVFYTGSVQHS